MKQFVAMLLALALLVAPGMSLASSQPGDSETVITLGEPITVNGLGATVSGSTVTIQAGGAYRATGSLADGMIEVNTADAVTLTLDGVTLGHSTGPAISVTNAATLSLVLAAGSTNTLTDAATYSDTSLKAALFSNDPLEISGDGALQVTGKYKHGIASDDTLTINGGAITVVSAVKDALHANDNITVNGGTVTVAQASSDAFESEGDLVIAGGVLTLAAAGDGLKSATALTINGGQTFTDVTGDALGSDGPIDINGGVTVALGGAGKSGVSCGDACELTLDGGTLAATGGANSGVSNNSAQRVVSLGSRTVGAIIRIARDDSADALTFKVSKAYTNMLYTSPALLANHNYTVYNATGVAGETAFHGLYTGATVTGAQAVATFTTDTVMSTETALTRLYLPLIAYSVADTIPATATPSPTVSASTATPTATNTPQPTVTPTPTSTSEPSGETQITLGSPITMSGAGATVSGNTVTITAGGAYRVAGSLADGMIAVNTTGAVQLTLAGVTLTHATGPAISAIDAAKLSLVLAAGTTNSLSDGASYADTSLKATVFSNVPLEISGSGALQVTGKYKHGIASDDNLVINGGALTIVSAATDGLHANDDITVHGGMITVVQTGSDGLESEGTLLIDGGAFELKVADDGIVSQDTLTINGGTINITAGVEGIESKNKVVVNDGSLTIAVSDDGLNATNDITVNGGQIYVNAGADGFDSNGSLSINGGVTVALGGGGPECGLDTDNRQPVLNGGIVVATGGSTSTPSSSSKQRVVVLGTRPTGSVIRINRADGTGVLTFQVSKAYQTMVFTSPAVQANTAHTAYSGGSATGGSNFHGLYTGATYSGGSTWATFTTSAVVTYVGGTPPGGH